MPQYNDRKQHYRCANCLHKHYWTEGTTFTLKDGKRVPDRETNFGSWGQCEDASCTCIALQRLSTNQLENLLNKAEEYCGRPIGHRPPGVVIPDVSERQGAASGAGRDGEDPTASTS